MNLVCGGVMKRKVFLILMLITTVLLGVIGCADKKNVEEETNADLIKDINIEELLEYKNSYMGDNSAVINIAEKLPWNIYREYVALETDNGENKIIISYKPNTDKDEKNYNDYYEKHNDKDIFKLNAVVMFSLIQNAEEIEFKLGRNIDEAFKSDLYMFDRKALEEEYGGDLKTLFSDKNSWDKFIDDNFNI